MLRTLDYPSINLDPR